MDYYILLRPEHQKEKEKRKANGMGFRTGFVFKGTPPPGWVLVHDRPIPAYEKEGDTREKVSLISFQLEHTSGL